MNKRYLSQCPYCGTESCVVEADAAECPDIAFFALCLKCGARGPAHRERFDFGCAEERARAMFAARHDSGGDGYGTGKEGTD